MNKKTRKGFTLVELLIVIAIIGVLAASMSLAVKDQTPKAQVAAIVSDFRLLRTAVTLYNIDSSDTTPTDTYFNAHSDDYLAGKLKKYTVANSSGTWTATYKGGKLSDAAKKAFTDSKDLGIEEDGDNLKMTIYKSK